MSRTALFGTSLLFLLAVAATVVATAGARSAAVPPLIFPVVGQVSYTDDFGDARAGGRHEGNDLMAPKRSIAVAVEPGTVKFWTTSARAGCMLYLYGDSGTKYLYIHLNNDLTLANDNGGKCVAGVSYAPGLKSGARVAAGQPVGFVGDSGDANGIASHLHFEVHPRGGDAVSPFPYLKRAKRLLVAAPPAGGAFTLKLQGTVVTAGQDEVDVKVDTLQAWPSHLKVTKLEKTITLAVPVGAPASSMELTSLTGLKVAVWTLPALPTLDALTGAAYALSAQKIELR
ncbi:MAG TPA: M23 family metallopeptidase [Gaiellaceae bacterium]|nr:M23 family metallopeptidase [Gaiellaceae bacterium]